MLNKTGPSVPSLTYTASYWPQTRLCTTGHHPQGQPFRQFSIHLTVCSSSPYSNSSRGCKTRMGDHTKGLTELQVDAIHCSSLIHWASHFIVEVQVGQAWLPLGEAMLTTPDDFLVLHVPEIISRISCSITFSVLKWFIKFMKKDSSMSRRLIFSELPLWTECAPNLFLSKCCFCWWTTKPTTETQLATEQWAKTIKKVVGSLFFCATQLFVANCTQALGGK